MSDTKSLDWTASDGFLLFLNSDQQQLIIDEYLGKIKVGTIHKSPHYIPHGWIQNCPRCKNIRITSCCACGCGSCLTCGYRFSCNPIGNAWTHSKIVIRGQFIKNEVEYADCI